MASAVDFLAAPVNQRGFAKNAVPRHGVIGTQAAVPEGLNHVSGHFEETVQTVIST